MRKINLVLFGILSVSNVLAAQDIPDTAKRCEQDSLDKNQAVQRVEWVLRCAQKHAREFYVNLGYNHNDPYESVMEELRWMWLFDRRGKVKPRPYYPTFATKDLKRGWVAPTSNDPHCKIKVPAHFAIEASCRSSCYTPGERLLYASGMVPIEEAYQEKLQGIMVVSDTSTLDKVELRPSPVKTYINSIRDTDHKILVFSMKSGGRLQVTPNHTLINETGFIKEAQDFQVGNSLVTEEGERDEITSIDTIDYYGKVFNVSPDSASLKGNLVVAEGYLSGSNWYQNDGFGNVNKRILREGMPKDLLER